jgi:3',5'-cyclic AMP phosphodiesterase CpdA
LLLTGSPGTIAKKRRSGHPHPHCRRLQSGADLATKLIHITDTNFVAPGLTLYGLDPRARLEAAITDINTHHADAELAVVTGDLTHWGEVQAYSNFLQCMRALRLPYIVLVGNHDRRAACLDVLPSAPRDPNGFVQGWRDTPRGRLLFLDTLDERSHAGELCDRRLAWCARALSDAPPDRPLYIFMHHPPFEIGVHMMDRIALSERADFATIVRPHRNRIRHLFFGHVHRPICGSWMGIPFSTLRGTNHQVWFDLSPDAPHMASHEPSAYAVVLVGDDTVVVHTHDYLDSSPRVPFTKPDIEDRAYMLGQFHR